MLVSRQGDADFVKVLDFGLAKVAADSLPTASEEPLETITRHGTIFGTPRYMAPEQCVGEEVDGRTDLYALGMIMYEMLAGKHPYDGSSVVQLVRQQLSRPAPPMSQRAPDVTVPLGLQAVVMRLVEKKPEERFESARALITALDALQLDVASGSSAAPSNAPAQEATTRPVTASALMLEPASEAPAAPAAPAAPISAAASTSEASPPPAAPAALAVEPAAVEKPALATGPVESPLPSFIARLPPPLRKRPALLLLPLLLFCGLLFVLLRSGDPPAPQVRSGTGRPQPQAVSPSELAPPQQLEQAVAAGLPALLELEKRFSRDATVKRKIAHMFMAQNNGLEALRWMARALPIDETLIFDGEILQAVGMASATGEGQESALTMLETEFGARGVDILFALSTKQAPGRGKKQSRVQQSLTKPEVRAHASPAALIAIDLRAAARCEAKRALLGRAGQDGDTRTLAQLKALTQARGCGVFGVNDCWPCLRQDGVLQAAINSISARSSLTH
jgi:hypothetical protein